MAQLTACQTLRHIVYVLNGVIDTQPTQSLVRDNLIFTMGFRLIKNKQDTVLFAPCNTKLLKLSISYYIIEWCPNPDKWILRCQDHGLDPVCETILALWETVGYSEYFA